MSNSLGTVKYHELQGKIECGDIRECSVVTIGKKKQILCQLMFWADTDCVINLHRYRSIKQEVMDRLAGRDNTLIGIHSMNADSQLDFKTPLIGLPIKIVVLANKAGTLQYKALVEEVCLTGNREQKVKEES